MNNLFMLKVKGQCVHYYLKTQGNIKYNLNLFILYRKTKPSDIPESPNGSIEGQLQYHMGSEQLHSYWRVQALLPQAAVKFGAPRARSSEFTSPPEQRVQAADAKGRFNYVIIFINTLIFQSETVDSVL